MNITIPVYVEQCREEDGPFVFVVRPLFFDHPAQRHEKLSKALSRAASSIRKALHRCVQESRHEELAQRTHCPPLRSTQLKLRLALHKRAAECRLLFVSFPGLGRTIAFTPSIPGLWFEIAKGQKLHERAMEVLQDHFEKLDKEVEGDEARPERFSPQGRAWVDYLELDVDSLFTGVVTADRSLAGISEEDEVSDEEELEACGRCISELFPDELRRAYLRDQEVGELEALLSAADQRPVLLVGPPRVGKTAIIHECVYRMAEKRHTPWAANKNVWLLSPQRLISGMSHVGQWENRLLAIIAEVKKRKHVLYFDDLPGLTHAGITSQSRLSVAQVLGPYLERREFQVLAEITPQSLRVLREQNRTFADQFHLLPVKEPSERQNLGILIQVMRYWEGKRECEFHIDALPAVLDLQRRYARHLAFPGKAADSLEQLSQSAGESHSRVAGRGDAIEQFESKSGLSFSFVDDRTTLARQDVVAALGQEVIGQAEALNAMADAVCIARARLNDPNRPLGTFLFLGPTGVGKTQCAKSLAKYLFSSTDRLVRFDMNEYATSSDVRRLTGAMGDPKGLLTSTIMQEPFCVLLLDEIEKAHPDAFDLLLQVLGEGRLTNALGQTADFTNTMIIMTSNLGTREATSRLGFGVGDVPRDDTFVQAAREHFRPEFFNRIDRIIPFRELKRADIQQIAQGLIKDVLEREGLHRRRCMLRVEAQAMELIVDAGYHPHLGARALKRAIERQLVQPVAARLAVMQPQTPVIIRIYQEGAAVASDTDELVNAEVQPLPEEHVDLSNPMQLLHRANAILAGVGAELPDLRFEKGVAATELTADHYRYLGIKRLLDRLDQECRHLARKLDKNRHPAIRGSALPSSWRRGYRLRDYRQNGSVYWRGIWAAEDIHEYLNELTGQAVPYGEGTPGRCAALIRGLCWLCAAAQSSRLAQANRCLIRITSILGQPTSQQTYLRDVYARYFGFLGNEAVRVLSEEARGTGAVGADCEILMLERTAAWAEARIEEGTHLFFPAHGNLIPVGVETIPLGIDTDPLEKLAEQMDRAARPSRQQAPGHAESRKDHDRPGPVLRLYHEGGAIIDCRSGLVVKDELAENLSVLLYSQLPIPPALLEGS